MPWCQMDHNSKMEGSRGNLLRLCQVVKHKGSRGGIQFWVLVVRYPAVRTGYDKGMNVK